MAARSSATRERLAEVLADPHRGASVVVEGAAGIGKTTLVQSALAGLTPDSARVVIEHCSPLRGHQPFAAVSQLVLVGSADPVADAYARVDEWCGSQPVVLWVDDAHYADPGSLAVLRRLWSATSVLPLIVVLTVRLEPRRLELVVLVEDADRRLTVDPLLESDIEAAVCDRFGVAPTPELRRKLDVAGGNPFVLTAMLGVLARRAAVLIRDGLADVDPLDPRVPDSAHAAIKGYVTLLSPEAIELATTVAALGSPADPGDLSALMHRSIAGLHRAFVEACDAGVLDWRGDAVVLRHDLYGEVLLSALSEPVRNALHRAAAQTLQARDAPPAEVAEQVLRSTDRDGAGLLRSVAAATIDTAPGVAADLLDHVQSVGAAADGDTFALERATALFLSGRGRDAEDLVRIQVPRTADPRARVEMRALALHSMVNRANTGAALAEVENLLAEPQLPPEAALALRGTRAWVLLLAGEIALAAAVLLEVDVLAQAAGVPAHRIAPSARAVSAYLQAQPLRALQILPSAQNPGVPYGGGTEATYEVWPPIFELFANGVDAAREASIRARETSAQRGAHWLSAFHDWISSATDVQRGQWDDSLAALDSGLQTAREFGTGWTATAVGNRALILAHRGRLDEARASLDSFDRSGLPIQFGLDYCALARLVVEEARAVARYQGEPAESRWRAEFEPVRLRAETVWGDARQRGGLMWMLTVGPYVARIGDDSLRVAVADALVGADLAETYWLSATRDLLVAIGRHDHAAVAHDAAALVRLGTVRDAAFGFEEAGLLAARAADTAAAGAHLRTATDLYHELGAISDIERLRARAHRIGVRIGAGTARREAVTGWAALTPTERVVADLVRDGLTNPAIAGQLYVSPRTVQTHVSHILRKTGLRSRVDIAAALAS